MTEAEESVFELATGDPLMCGGLLERGPGVAVDPPSPFEGGDEEEEEEGTPGLFSTTTAERPSVVVAGDCSSGLLDPASSSVGQLMGSVFLLSLSSNALRARCLEGGWQTTTIVTVIK